MYFLVLLVGGSRTRISGPFVARQLRTVGSGLRTRSGGSRNDLDEARIQGSSRNARSHRVHGAPVALERGARRGLRQLSSAPSARTFSRYRCRWRLSPVELLVSVLFRRQKRSAGRLAAASIVGGRQP